MNDCPQVEIRMVCLSRFGSPQYATSGSAGCDLQADITEGVQIPAGGRALIPTGIFIALPEGYEAQIRSRSGLTLKYGIVVANGVGTIDSDYRGEIKVILLNVSAQDYTVSPGEKIAQMVFSGYSRAAFRLCDDLDDTVRGNGGFGHSGK